MTRLTRHFAGMPVPAVWILCLAPVGAGCTGSGASGGGQSRAVSGVDVAQCLRAEGDAEDRHPGHCPGYLAETLASAAQACTEMSGRLLPVSAPAIWSLDVNGDGTPEFAFATDGIVGCADYPSLFSCGSLGCPLVLYEERAGRWQEIAQIHADAPESIEVLGAPRRQGYAELRVGCLEGPPCAEYWYYGWTGGHYEPTYLDVRGFRVDFAGSVHGLRGLVGATRVLATPEAGGNVVGEYGPGTEVEIIGTTRDADYYYVSPCNACDSGFVPRSAVAGVQAPRP